MPEYNYTLDGSLPKGYPEPIEHAWFPTNEACEQFNMESHVGYLSLLLVFDHYPEVRDSDIPLTDLIEVVPVRSVEDCTIVTGFSA